MLKFNIVSLSTAFIATALCIALLFAPEIIFRLFTIEEDSSAFFIGRRTAMLFLGIAVLSWVGRNAAHSESRQAICLGLAVSMFALALMGIAEYIRGFVGIGIFLAVVTECILAVMYFTIWYRHKKSN